MAEDNATYLFTKPSAHYHSSESFWTSAFALYLLYVSRSFTRFKIPVYRYREEGGEWGFDPDGFLDIPQRLDPQKVVVEGKIQSGFIPGLGTLPNELLNLRLDMLIHGETEVVVIEVKTVGEKIGDQAKKYGQLIQYLREKGRKASLYFLISAGHEAKSDWPILRAGSQGRGDFKLLLWEQVLKQLYEEAPESAWAKCLGDVSQYYREEDRYMHLGWEPIISWPSPIREKQIPISSGVAYQMIGTNPESVIVESAVMSGRPKGWRVMTPSSTSNAVSQATTTGTTITARPASHCWKIRRTRWGRRPRPAPL